MISLSSPHSFFVLTLGVLLGIVAAGMLVYLLRILASAFGQSFGGFFEQAAFRHCRTRCTRGDECLEKGDVNGALRAFADAFCLRTIRRDADLLSEIANYHTGLLSRLLTIADELGKGRVRLLSLARVDRLLAERLETQLEYFRMLKRKDRERVRETERRLRDNQGQ
ncbi:MAG: hypothetical protein AB7P18_00825, partial [Candidatus Binatia bacterium]